MGLNLSYQKILKVLVILTVVVVTVNVLLYWKTDTQLKQTIVGQTETQYTILAKSAASYISQFLKEKEKDLLLLSEIKSIQAQEEKVGREKIAVLVAKMGNDFLGDIVRIDKEGKAIWVVNGLNNREGEGISLADREYFIWAKNQLGSGEIHLSTPLVIRIGMIKNKAGVAIVTPIFNEGKFNGAILMGFAFNDLANKFVLPSALTAETRSEIKTGEEGIEGNVVLGEVQALAKNNLIVAEAPIAVKEKEWALSVSVPLSLTKKTVEPLHISLTLILTVFLSELFVIILVFLIGARVAQKEAFLRGFKEGKSGVKQPVGKS